MATSASLEDFAPKVEKDAVCLFYRSNGLYLMGSQEAENLCDEIQRLEIALHAITGIENTMANNRDRSTTVITALRFVRDYTQGLLENAQLDAGEI